MQEFRKKYGEPEIVGEVQPQIDINKLIKLADRLNQIPVEKLEQIPQLIDIVNELIATTKALHQETKQLRKEVEVLKTGKIVYFEDFRKAVIEKITDIRGKIAEYVKWISKAIKLFEEVGLSPPTNPKPVIWKEKGEEKGIILVPTGYGKTKYYDFEGNVYADIGWLSTANPRIIEPSLAEVKTLEKIYQRIIEKAEKLGVVLKK